LTILLKKAFNMNSYFKKLVIGVLAASTLLAPACTLDYTNPNAATEDAVLSNPAGLLAFSNGLRRRYTLGGAGPLYTTITASGLTTNELRVVNAGNADIAALANGRDNVNGLNPVIINMWQNLNILNADCERVIAAVAAGAIPERPLANAVQAHAHLYRALALGWMATFWEQVPVRTGRQATFVPRNAALEEAVRLCEEGVTLLGTAPLPASFTSVVGTDIDLPNALSALSARYNLMLGRLDQALTAANRVNLASRSRFVFDNIAQNPIFRSSFITNNVHEAQTNLGLPAALSPSASDLRVSFYITSAVPPRGRGFFKSDDDPIPLYLPGEVILIRAEVFARQNRLADAAAEVNRILTKIPAQDAWGVGANLPANNTLFNQATILEEIYRNRCIELYLTGQRLEDSRRFNRPGPTAPGAERNRNFYPYPFTERDNNPNTPPDPAL
jgi:hypothetical protein